MGQNIVKVWAFVLNARNIEEVTTRFLEPAAKAGCAFATYGDEGKVKFVWRMCAQSLERGDGHGTSLVDDGKPMGSIEYTSLKIKWKGKHNFLFTSKRKCIRDDT